MPGMFTMSSAERTINFTTYGRHVGETLHGLKSIKIIGRYFFYWPTSDVASFLALIDE